MYYLSSLLLSLNEAGVGVSLSGPTATPVDLQKSQGLPRELAGDVCQEEQSHECLGTKLA